MHGGSSKHPCEHRQRSVRGGEVVHGGMLADYKHQVWQQEQQRHQQGQHAILEDKVLFPDRPHLAHRHVSRVPSGEERSFITRSRGTSFRGNRSTQSSSL